MKMFDIKKLIELPDDVFAYHVLHYLRIIDIVTLDNSCLNHMYRNQILNKLNGIMLEGKVVIVSLCVDI